MFRKRQPQRVTTTFRGYFHRQALNRLVKNLYIVIPDIPSLAKRVNANFSSIVAPLLAKLFKKHGSVRERISLIDLSALNDTLAMRLKKSSTRMVKLNTDNLQYEKINLNFILQKQAEMLRELVKQQQSVLKEQSKDFIQKTLEQRKQRQSKNRNRK